MRECLYLNRYDMEILGSDVSYPCFDWYRCFRCGRNIHNRSYIPDKNLYTPWRAKVEHILSIARIENGKQRSLFELMEVN